MLQIISSNYARVRHYKALIDGKPKFEYHRNSIQYITEKLKSLDPKDPNTTDPKSLKSSSNNQNKSGRSPAWLRHRPPTPLYIDWSKFREYISTKYSASWSKDIWCYSMKYSNFLENVKEIESLPVTIKSNVIKSLVVLSKFLGTYNEFKDKLKTFGIKAKKQTAFDSFVRILNANNNTDLPEWYKKACNVLNPNEQTFLKFTSLSGIRKGEAIASFNKIIQLSKENKLSEYYNKDLQCSEHFKYPKEFIRGSKNLFITFIREDLVSQIANSEPVSYGAIRKRLLKVGKLRINELRDYFATFTVRHGLIKEEVDILQGRIGNSIFMRNYFSPGLKELRDRTLEAIKLLEQQYT